MCIVEEGVPFLPKATAAAALNMLICQAMQAILVEHGCMCPALQAGNS